MIYSSTSRDKLNARWTAWRNLSTVIDVGFTGPAHFAEEVKWHLNSCRKWLPPPAVVSIAPGNELSDPHASVSLTPMAKPKKTKAAAPASSKVATAGKSPKPRKSATNTIDIDVIASPRLCPQCGTTGKSRSQTCKEPLCFNAKLGCWVLAWRDRKAKDAKIPGLWNSKAQAESVRKSMLISAEG